MKFNFRIIVACSLLLSFSACKSKKAILSGDPTPTPPVVEQSKVLPSFPWEAIYVVTREYEAITSGESANEESTITKLIVNQKYTFDSFLELRLMSLYPDRSYPGMIKDIKRIAREAERRYKVEYLETHRELPIALGSDSTPVHTFVSLTDEATWLGMTAQESLKFNALNRLATQKSFATAKEIEQYIHFDHLSNGDLVIPKFLQENLMINALFPGGSHLLYRIYQCKERAIFMAESYYKGRTDSGKIGDAYRHLTVNMLLTKFLSADLAYWVMDVYWETQGKNAPCDKYMDFHNNHVGRTTQFKRFTQSLGDTTNNNWESWCRNIYDFVEDPSNAILKGWNQEMMEMSIKSDEKETDKQKYIYWNIGGE